MFGFLNVESFTLIYKLGLLWSDAEIYLMAPENKLLERQMKYRLGMCLMNKTKL